VGYVPTCSTGRAASITSGVEVSESSVLPAQFSRVQIPAQRYVIFLTANTCRNCTVNAIWSQWLQESGHKAARAAASHEYIIRKGRSPEKNYPCFTNFNDAEFMQ
jgi:predicted transcriptional regulator YdeE